jgi:hypothetical protein
VTSGALGGRVVALCEGQYSTEREGGAFRTNLRPSSGPRVAPWLGEVLVGVETRCRPGFRVGTRRARGTIRTI